MIYLWLGLVPFRLSLCVTSAGSVSRKLVQLQGHLTGRPACLGNCRKPPPLLGSRALELQLCKPRTCRFKVTIPVNFALEANVACLAFSDHQSRPTRRSRTVLQLNSKTQSAQELGKIHHVASTTPTFTSHHPPSSLYMMRPGILTAEKTGPSQPCSVSPLAAATSAGLRLLRSFRYIL